MKNGTEFSSDGWRAMTKPDSVLLLLCSALKATERGSEEGIDGLTDGLRASVEISFLSEMDGRASLHINIDALSWRLRE